MFFTRGAVLCAGAVGVFYAISAHALKPPQNQLKGAGVVSTFTAGAMHLSEKFTLISDDFLVAPQLTPDDIAEAARAGVTLIVNNRPDGEMIGQPTSAALERAARDAGISYIHLPVDGRGVSSRHVDELRRAAASAPDGKTLAFCRSGMRSTIVWSYAAAADGKEADEIIQNAHAAGFDIAGHAPTLTAIAEKAK